MPLNIRKGDGLILRSGSRMIADGESWNRGNPLFDDWRVAAWTEDGEMRFPIQVSAIVEVWRVGTQVFGDNAVVQLELKLC